MSPEDIAANTLVFITDITPVSRPLKAGHNLEVPMTQEDIMSMEKRAVVNTPKEKTAHKTVGKELKKPQPAKKTPAKKEK